MDKVTFSTFDASKYLDTQEAIDEYLAIALEDGDTKTVQLVLRDIAKAHGMSKLAQETKLNRESLYKSLSKEGNPSFATISKILKALGLHMTLAVNK
ncbi:addiction module antidote protein [Gardnerella vaginalis]|uniref:addiction module antidote protein n=1 Tax=Gardnerella TaxID=2701 RepID=UPI0003538C36|nr:addiction module antidote protein [Gardnerella vaginalis]EPI43377.1 putative addiction module antidote protein [Gardnerella vaginalis JCP8481B]EPI43862.1 putative addiction module antidote protein [Gardnerella vaginalis JCP8481A]